MNWLDECRVAAEALPQETRQKFLDLMWAGKTLGEAQRETGISFDAANGIVQMNIVTEFMVRRESV